ncbi:MAG: NAD(P)-dependent oxidoreductase, partial [Chlorobium sp.]|nr:NAD(P)-dependent oxidoreductase [Chlorobium sp.]
RPLYDLRDAISGFLRAIQADYSISGAFNVASGNYTVGQVGDMVKDEVEKLTGRKIKIDLKNVQDFRNYKVTIEKARTYLGFQPQYTVTDIIMDLYDHLDLYGDFEKDDFYNIRVFKANMEQQNV